MSTVCSWKRFLLLLIMSCSIWALFFDIEGYEYLINQLQSVMTMELQNTATTTPYYLQNITEECMSADQNISLLPAYNDPQTKIIRSTILQHIIPPLFISFGGSGNTFVRLLIEYVTKIYTGSIYHGEFLLHGYVGSNYCVTETIVVKYHGEHLRQPNLTSIINGNCICGCTRFEAHHTTMQEFTNIHGTVSHTGAIFLIRNPWDAFFALFQYWRGIKGPEGRHKAHILLKRFKIETFKGDVNIGVRKWIRNMEALLLWQKLGAPFIVIKFENIVSPNMEIKTNELLKIMKFLYRDEYYKQHEGLFRHRINCLWNISKTDKRMNAIHRDKAWPNQLNKTFAYQALARYDSKFLCEAWKKLKPYATGYGYTAYQSMSC